MELFPLSPSQASAIGIQDRLRPVAGQDIGAHGKGNRPFGIVPQGNARYDQGGGFLLQTAAVGQHHGSFKRLRTNAKYQKIEYPNVKPGTTFGLAVSGKISNPVCLQTREKRLKDRESNQVYIGL